MSSSPEIWKKRNVDELEEPSTQVFINTGGYPARYAKIYGTLPPFFVELGHLQQRQFMQSPAFVLYII